MDNKKFIGLLIIVTLLSGLIGGYIGGLVGNNQSVQNTDTSLGASTPGTRYPHGITVGLPANSPTNLGDVKAGTCSLIGLDVAQAASTTRPYDCAVTGMVSGDLVFFTEATTSATYATTNAPFRIVGAKASTTAGYITFGVENYFGASQAPGNIGGIQTGFGSSTEYLIVKTQ